MASTNPARGMYDFLPADIRKCNYVINIIKEVYESHGFEELEKIGAFQKKITGEDKSVEANALLAVNEALDRLGVKNFAMYLSHSDVLTDILEAVGVPEALRTQTFDAIRSFSKFNIEGFINDLQGAGVTEKASTVLADLFLKTDEILNQEHDVNQTVVVNLLNIVNNETLAELGQILRLTGRKPVLIDPALPCESPFGDGIVVEVRTSGLDILGNGGCIRRSEVDSTVFAFSFEIENIIELMESTNAFPPATAVSGSKTL